MRLLIKKAECPYCDKGKEDMDNSELTIVIPVYNEEESLKWFLPEVISFCKKNHFDLMTVDDASTDASLSILQKASEDWNGLTVLHHKVNRGYGGAVSSGLAAVQTEWAVTMDADGQHRPADVLKLCACRDRTDADLVIGSRKDAEKKNQATWRSLGKKIIRAIAGMLVDLHVTDLNTGMKLYRTDLAKRYLPLCPASMAFSDVITLIFVQKKHLVIEEQIEVDERKNGKSTINTMTALDTILQILNIVMVFNPMRIFIPTGSIAILVGIIWAIPFFIRGNGLSTGAMMAMMTGIILIMLGLIAEQLAQIRKKDL